MVENTTKPKNKALDLSDLGNLIKAKFLAVEGNVNMLASPTPAAVAFRAEHWVDMPSQRTMATLINGQAAKHISFNTLKQVARWLGYDSIKV